MANFEKHLPKIVDVLNRLKSKVLTAEEFEGLITKLKTVPGIKSASRNSIKSFILNKYIKEGKLEGDTSSIFYYYINSKIDQYDIASARSRSSFFSHYSALSIHNLTIQLPKQIYLTWERKTMNYNTDMEFEILQEDVDRVFNKPPRITTDKRRYKNYTINVIKGQNHNELGVQPFRKNLWVSDIERTLIDVAVRPFYAGGTTQVLQAFEAARKVLDTKKLYSYYVYMFFKYPYHKVIGFYLEKAGYDSEDYLPFLNLPSYIDFYLTYNILHKEYNSKWKLFIPKGF
jgi:hypothetical protein